MPEPEHPLMKQAAEIAIVAQPKSRDVFLWQLPNRAAFEIHDESLKAELRAEDRARLLLILVLLPIFFGTVLFAASNRWIPTSVELLIVIPGLLGFLSWYTTLVLRYFLVP